MGAADEDVGRRMSDIGKCEHCGGEFENSLIHTGFNESADAMRLLAGLHRGSADPV
jgi:hypothetical protein